MKKSWWESKTLWANALTIAGVILATESGFPLPLTPEQQVTLLALVNMLLRMVTSEGVK